MWSRNVEFFDPRTNYYSSDFYEKAAGKVSDGMGVLQDTLFKPSFPPENPVTGEMVINNNYTGNVDDEKSLLEELEIDLSLILKKTLIIFIPFRIIEIDLEQDADLGGPTFYLMLFGFLLFVSGKFSGFGVIYMLTVVTSLVLYSLVNLMCENHVSLYTVTSVVGYSLIPLILLACYTLIFNSSSRFDYLIFAIFVSWSSVVASKMLTHIMVVCDRFFLIFYPCFMLFGLFAANTLFKFKQVNVV